MSDDKKAKEMRDILSMGVGDDAQSLSDFFGDVTPNPEYGKPGEPRYLEKPSDELPEDVTEIDHDGRPIEKLEKKLKPGDRVVGPDGAVQEVQPDGSMGPLSTGQTLNQPIQPQNTPAPVQQGTEPASMVQFRNTLPDHLRNLPLEQLATALQGEQNAMSQQFNILLEENRRLQEQLKRGSSDDDFGDYGKDESDEDKPMTKKEFMQMQQQMMQAQHLQNQQNAAETQLRKEYGDQLFDLAFAKAQQYIQAKRTTDPYWAYRFSTDINSVVSVVRWAAEEIKKADFNPQGQVKPTVQPNTPAKPQTPKPKLSPEDVEIEAMRARNIRGEDEPIEEEVDMEDSARTMRKLLRGRLYDADKDKFI